MLRHGLTGGRKIGKSAVAAMLREMGFAVLDADSLAHRLIEPGNPAYDEVLQEFGQAVLAPGGRVDRAKLSAIVFNDRARLDRLNAIVHPRVAEARRRIAAQLPVAEKLRLATEKIDCSGSLEQTRLQVQALAGKLRRTQTAR